MTEGKPGRDLYRDTNVRFLGYANEVGEAFRSLVPAKLVHMTYGIASLYVVADTIDKAGKAYEKPAVNNKSKACQVVVAGVDTLLWQSFASIIIPGFTINRVCALSLLALNTTKLPGFTTKWISTGIGLACIPYIVKPIDEFVDYAMDNTFRKVAQC